MLSLEVQCLEIMSSNCARALAFMTLSEVNAAQTNYVAAVTSASRAVELAPTTVLSTFTSELSR